MSTDPARAHPRENITPMPGSIKQPHAQYVSSINPERTRWLSRGRMAYGKLTILDGDPGLGKSTLTLDWAARISRGEPLPDGQADRPRGVVILSAEDGAADTIRPRLDVADADLTRIVLLNMQDELGNDFLVSLPEDLDAIEQAIAATDAALVIIDPFVAFLSEKVNANRDQDVRRTLAPLASMAQRSGAAILLVRHLNKAAGVASLYRGGGSIGIVGAARFALLVAKDPDDETGRRRTLAVQKANIGVEEAALDYELDSVPGTDVARVRWLGASRHTATSLLDVARHEEDRSALGEAKEWIIDKLSPGPMTAKEIQRLAREDGIKDATLRRAKEDLKILRGRSGFGDGGYWTWTLPIDVQRIQRRPPDTDAWASMQNLHQSNENDPFAGIDEQDAQ